MATPAIGNDAATTSAEPSTPISRWDSSNSATGSFGRRMSATGRIRSASLKFIESNPPRGFLAATGDALAQAPSLADLRSGSYGERSSGRRSSASSKNRPSAPTPNSPTPYPQSSVDPISETGAPQLPPIAVAADEKQKGPARRNIVEDIQEDEGPQSNDSWELEGDKKQYDKPTIKQVTTTPRKSKAPESDEDGLPSMLFGRGEMTNQAYEGTPNRLSKPILSPAKGDTLGEEEDDEDEDLFPKPKRNSKNIKAMLGEAPSKSSSMEAPVAETKPVADPEGYYPNGYHFPPKKTSGQAFMIGLKAFWKFSITPLGFLILIYGLNVVAWGGMLFLLLCNASPVLCYVNGVYSCNDINAPRRIWIEIDSQILNALFCVTGFGLIPWRFRDWYFLIRFRVFHDPNGLRRLAGYHNSWFRLQGSDALPVPPLGVNDPAYEVAPNDPRIPIPIKSAPKIPLTGVRAPPTPLWKMDYVVNLFVMNTFLQAVLSGFMWGLNRYNRPSWSTGLFVALACIVAAMAGLMQFQEGKRIKKVEGVPLSTAETLAETAREAESTGPGQVAMQRLATEKEDEKEKAVEAGSASAGIWGLKGTASDV